MLITTTCLVRFEIISPIPQSALLSLCLVTNAIQHPWSDPDDDSAYCSPRRDPFIRGVVCRSGRRLLMRSFAHGPATATQSRTRAGGGDVDIEASEQAAKSLSWTDATSAELIGSSPSSTLAICASARKSVTLEHLEWFPPQGFSWIGPRLGLDSAARTLAKWRPRGPRD